MPPHLRLQRRLALTYTGRRSSSVVRLTGECEQYRHAGKEEEKRKRMRLVDWRTIVAAHDGSRCIWCHACISLPSISHISNIGTIHSEMPGVARHSSTHQQHHVRERSHAHIVSL